MTRIALVANKGTADLYTDGPLLLASFDAIGVAAEIVPWGSGPAWAGFDAVVIRNTWDYVLDRTAFLNWAGEVSRCTRLANSLAVLDWNTDKRYLRALEAQGIPTVPTIWVEPGDTPPLVDWDDFVVKPSVSAGARLSARYQRSGDFQHHIGQIHAMGATAMIQPYLPSVDDEGETGTYVFGGEVSHAIRKGPVLASGGTARKDFSGGATQPVGPTEVSAELAAFALLVIDAAPSVVYARVDTAPDADGRPILLELEATEPFLFLEHAPAGADRFARAVVNWLEGPRR